MSTAAQSFAYFFNARLRRTRHRLKPGSEVCGHETPDPSSGRPEGRTAWIFSDGKAGHEAQCLGVVEALGLAPEIKRTNLAGIYKLKAPWGPLPAGEARGEQGGPLAAPWPAFAFATGRTTIPYIRALRRRAGLQTFTVILMDPKTGPNSADLIWVPQHDRRRGPNVVTTLTAPHRFSARCLEALKASIPPGIAALPKPRIACLIGGPNGDYRYADGDEERLVALARLPCRERGWADDHDVAPHARTARIQAEACGRRNARGCFGTAPDKIPIPTFSLTPTPS